MSIHPRDALHGADAPLPPTLPVCDHYCGTPKTMQRSLQLQADMTREFGRCVFDVTLDCEDGAPVGEEAAHAARIADMALAAPPGARIAARLHPVGHPAFAGDMATIAGRAGARLTHLMIPKVESAADIDAAERALLQAYAPGLPLHALIESPAAVQRAFEIAAHPRVQSISFGLMDFVSAHGGAIPSSAMGSEGQFTHPLVVRAKLEIAAAAHAAGKVPAHCVVTEFRNTATLT
ncbi:MAG: CoA ester lyase, partial [Rhodocyclaceae bacterium]|nr:CoA ester lyase [Rhodocyclaceae bacterium]